MAKKEKKNESNHSEEQAYLAKEMSGEIYFGQIEDEKDPVTVHSEFEEDELEDAETSFEDETKDVVPSMLQNLGAFLYDVGTLMEAGGRGRAPQIQGYSVPTRVIPDLREDIDELRRKLREAGHREGEGPDGALAEADHHLKMSLDPSDDTDEDNYPDEGNLKGAYVDIAKALRRIDRRRNPDLWNEALLLLWWAWLIWWKNVNTPHFNTTNIQIVERRGKYYIRFMPRAILGNKDWSFWFPIHRNKRRKARLLQRELIRELSKCKYPERKTIEQLRDLRYP